jgi:ACS family allantoate permease-like MFS transporter
MSDSILKHQVDEKIEMAAGKDPNELVVSYHIAPEDEKAVLRKLDRVILPLMALVYFFQCESSMKMSEYPANVPSPSQT